MSDNHFLGFQSDAFIHDSHVTISLFLSILTLSFLLSMILTYIISEKYQLTFIPEPAITISIGILVSTCVYAVIAHTGNKETMNGQQALQIITFNNTMFFFGFLPPIIFCSGVLVVNNNFSQLF